VDDDKPLRVLLAELLSREDGIECNRCFCSAKAALAALAQESPPQVILLDIHLGPENGIDAIQPILSLAPTTRVLMLTTFYDSQEEAQALRAGASAFLVKSAPMEQTMDYLFVRPRAPINQLEAAPAITFTNGNPRQRFSDHVALEVGLRFRAPSFFASPPPLPMALASHRSPTRLAQPARSVIETAWWVIMEDRARPVALSNFPRRPAPGVSVS